MATLRDLLDHLRAAADPDAHTPLWPPTPSGRWWASWVLPPDELARVDAVTLRDLGHGHDPFGLSRDGVAVGLLVTHWLYHHYFRVVSHGIEHVPATGPVVLAANHSGTLPLDALMICADLIRHGPANRVPRTVIDYFVGRLPWVSTLFARAGAIGGARGNFHELLSHGELVVVFPEGTRGIGKGWAKRYQLQRWTEGHAELAIRHGAPVVPVAVIGAEESWPQLTRIEGVRALGIPYLPIPATPVPLPTRLHVWYGEPIPLHLEHAPAEATDAAVVSAAAARVRDAVDALIQQGLAARTSVFA